MKISDIGESGIIEIFRKNFIMTSNIVMGVNTEKGVYNDAGVIKLDETNLLIVTTDMIGLKTHIPDIASPEQVGKKAITVNISDLAAMGAKPIGVVMSVGVPAFINISYLEKVAVGMGEAAKKYDTCVFGGDVNKTDDLILAGTALGITTEDKLFTRNNAEVGDIVCVTGPLGDSAAAYYAWKNQLELPLDVKKRLFPRFLEPEARIKESLKLRDLHIVSSCGDISDGLGWELYKTGQASGVGFLIYEENIPINKELFYVANKLEIDPMDMVLYHGEDFELLITIKREKWNEYGKKMHEFGVKLYRIGEVCDMKSGNRLIRKDNTESIIKNLGYDQFIKDN
ncbi:MAG: thiamine-phosphate kinase [Candidatus Helarchaeota archaeon]